MYLLIPALVFLFTPVVLATTVYKTVDANGVVGFSDNPPVGSTPTEVLQLEAAPAQAPEEHLARLEAMREATDRLASDRREREKHRAELREIRARTASYEPPQPSVDTRVSSYYPLYSRSYRRIVRPPYRPGYRPKPEHPIVRPPAFPGPGIIRSSNQQLMRPLVSTR
jgi:Domain of unknown function (DUF4124)